MLFPSEDRSVLAPQLMTRPKLSFGADQALPIPNPFPMPYRLFAQDDWDRLHDVIWRNDEPEQGEIAGGVLLFGLRRLLQEVDSDRFLIHRIWNRCFHGAVYLGDPRDREPARESNIMADPNQAVRLFLEIVVELLCERWGILDTDAMLEIVLESLTPAP